MTPRPLRSFQHRNRLISEQSILCSQLDFLEAVVPWAEASYPPSQCDTIERHFATTFCHSGQVAGMTAIAESRQCRLSDQHRPVKSRSPHASPPQHWLLAHTIWHSHFPLSWKQFRERILRKFLSYSHGKDCCAHPVAFQLKVPYWEKVAAADT